MVEPEQVSRRLLQGDVAGRPGIAMAEAGQKIDICRPGADSPHIHECGMRFIGRQGAEPVEVEGAVQHGSGDRAEGADLWPRLAGGAEVLVACRGQPRGADLAHHLFQPLPEPAGRPGRDLLEHDDVSEAGKARRASAQGRRSVPGMERRHERAQGAQLGERGVEIGLRVDARGACLRGRHGAIIGRLMAAPHHPDAPIPPAAAVLRFAPSPNGLLHLGHALSALENRLSADRLGGRLLLRIEDIDTTRCRPAFEAAARADLAWLGITFDGPVRRQSEHPDAYRAALDRLDAMGLIFASFESRTELKALARSRTLETGRPWPCDPDGAPLYAGAGRTLSRAERETRIAAGHPHALRLDMAAAMARLGEPLFWTEVDAAGRPLREVAAHPERWGDVVLARKDVGTSYHLSVVVDDALQGVTHVVRGADLFEATAVHRLLQHLLGLPVPLYRHHRLILGPDGRKLSKSEKATGLAALREAGATPGDIRRMVGFDG